MMMQKFDTERCSRDWANSQEAAEALQDLERDAVVYLLLLHVRDRLPLQNTEQKPFFNRRNNSHGEMKMFWKDIGILSYDMIRLEIKYHGGKSMVFAGNKVNSPCFFSFFRLESH